MSYQDDLILSMYNRGEPGLAMAEPLPKDDPNKPVKAPGKDGVPSSPYLPGKAPFKLANLADGEPDASIMNYVTVDGFFLDGQGRAYMQTGGKLYDAGQYNPDIHGLPVPLVQQMQINPMMAGIVGAPHSNVRIDTGTSIKTGESYKRVLPDFGAGRIGNVRLKKGLV